MVLRGFEDRLERLVEGMFARAFRTGLQPVEVGRRLIRDVDANRTLDVHGRTVAPNRFEISLATEDFERFAQIKGSLITELVATVRAHGADEGLMFLGRISVNLLEDADLTVGMFRTTPLFDETINPNAPMGWLMVNDGTVLELPARQLTLGRMPSCDVVLPDPNSSREHAQLHPDGDSFVLIDLGSTNGSRVNGERVTRRLLVDGDTLTFGTVSLTFRQA